MSTHTTGEATALSRREFMMGTGSILAGAAAAGLASPAEAAKRHPQRGGELRFATQADSLGLDPHRNVIYLVSHPLAATTQGLLDLDINSSPVPGIATEWSISKDVLTYTFKLRQGVLFHNGREIDAAAVKWNYERIKDPKKSHAFTRSALGNLKEVEALDKYTLRCHLHRPSAAFLANVVYYPCNLIAPDSERKWTTIPSAVARSNSSNGNGTISPSWTGLKTTLKPMPRAIICPTSTALSAGPKSKTGCA